MSLPLSLLCVWQDSDDSLTITSKHTLVWKMKIGKSCMHDTCCCHQQINIQLTSKVNVCFIHKQRLAFAFWTQKLMHQPNVNLVVHFPPFSYIELTCIIQAYVCFGNEAVNENRSDFNLRNKRDIQGRSLCRV